MNRPRSRTGSRGTSGELRTPPSNIQVPPPVSQGGANRSATSFYQITINIIDRLSCIPSCQEYLEPDYLSRLTGSEIASMDPVTTLWNIFRLGNLLCELANISQAPAGQPLKIEPGNNLTNLNMCKRSIYSFLVFCKRIQIPEKDTFSITELFKNDTNGFVHVLRTVSLVLDYLQDRGLIDTSNPQPHRFSAASTIFGDPSSPPTDNRAKCVHELLQTERVYIQDLEKLQSHNATLSSKGTLPPFTLVNIFANINALLDFQRKFLIGIEASASQIPEQQLFGGMFVQMEQGFSVYETFCSNYKNASHIVVEEQKKLSEIPSVVDPGSGLGSLLIKPVQRICKYPLLLQEILKLTDPTWPTYTDLQEGIAAIKRVNDRVNSALARVENQAKARELVHRVKDWKEYSVASFGDLLLSSKFVMSTSDSEREMWVYLFERILICCKEIPQKKAKKSKDGTDGTPSQLQLKGRIYMTSVTNVKNISRENKFMLKVLWRDAETGSFVLKCQNEEQLKQWQTLMEKLIHANDADDVTLVEGPSSHHQVPPSKSSPTPPSPYSSHPSGGSVHPGGHQSMGPPSRPYPGHRQHPPPPHQQGPHGQAPLASPGYKNVADALVEATLGVGGGNGPLDSTPPYHPSSSSHSFPPNAGPPPHGGPGAGNGGGGGGFQVDYSRRKPVDDDAVSFFDISDNDTPGEDGIPLGHEDSDRHPSPSSSSPPSSYSSPPTTSTSPHHQHSSSGGASGGVRSPSGNYPYQNGHTMASSSSSSISPSSTRSFSGGPTSSKSGHQSLPAQHRGPPPSHPSYPHPQQQQPPHPGYAQPHPHPLPQPPHPHAQATGNPGGAASVSGLTGHMERMRLASTPNASLPGGGVPANGGGVRRGSTAEALRRTSGRSPQPPSSSSSLGRPPLSTAMSAHGNPSAGPTLGQDPSGFEGPGGGGSTGYVGQGMSPAEQAAVNGGGGSRPSFRSRSQSTPDIHAMGIGGRGGPPNWGDAPEMPGVPSSSSSSSFHPPPPPGHPPPSSSPSISSLKHHPHPPSSSSSSPPTSASASAYHHQQRQPISPTSESAPRHGSNGSGSGVGPTGSVKLKVNYQDDVYIIPVVNNISFEELITKLDRKIRLCGGTPPSSAEGFRIRYHDEDGDFVTIKNDEDVATSFEGRDLSNSATILNIFVS